MPTPLTPPDPFGNVPPQPGAPSDNNRYGVGRHKSPKPPPRVHGRPGVAATGEGPRGGDTSPSAISHPEKQPKPKAPPRPPPRPPVTTLLPAEVQEKREADALLQAEADEARAAGLPVLAEPGDTAATATLKARLAAEHLRVEQERGTHAKCLHFLTDVVEGKVKGVDEDGDEVPLHPRHQIAAAKAAMQASHRATAGAPIHVENANIIAAGDVIARADPDKLAAAVARRRAAIGA